MQNLLSWNNSPFQSESVFYNLAPGSYELVIQEIDGCGYFETTLIVRGFQLFFTPNGDGYFDKWKIYGLDELIPYKINIYDRYGKLLKQLSPLSEGWDGTFNGKPLPATDYWFTVIYEEPGTEIIKTSLYLHICMCLNVWKKNHEKNLKNVWVIPFLVTNEFLQIFLVRFVV